MTQTEQKRKGRRARYPQAPKSRWLRLYTEILWDPKIATLSDSQFRAWVQCLCMASMGDGKLPCSRDIAFHMRVSAAVAEQIVSDLILMGLIDPVQEPDGRCHYSPHGWKKRQYQSDHSGADRMQKHRAKQCSVKPSDTDVTSQLQERDDFSSVSDSVSASVLEARPYPSQEGSNTLSVRDTRAATRTGARTGAANRYALAKNGGAR